ncbi:SHOCT domain-containing protein [Nitrospira sp. Nam74]
MVREAVVIGFAMLVIGLGAAACKQSATRLGCETCQSTSHVVRLQRIPAESRTERKSFDHPFDLPAADWARILQAIAVQREQSVLIVWTVKGASEPAFRQEQITYLSRALSQTLAEARPDEQAVFALSEPRSAELEDITTGAWFHADGLLWLVLPNFRVVVSMPTIRDALWREPLIVRPGAAFDFVAGKYESVFPESRGLPNLVRAVSPTLRIAYRGLLGAVRSESAVGPPGTGPRPSAPERMDDEASIDDRLRRLKRLHDEHVLSDEEYLDKKRELLKRF